MRFMLLLIAILLIASSSSAQSQSRVPFLNAPYLYYYSDVLNGVVVERADGTDSRLLAPGLMEEPAGYLLNGGWSPSGEWLALLEKELVPYTWLSGRGYAVNMRGEKLELLERFDCVHAMLWHRSRDLLFVMGEINQPRCGQGNVNGVVTYWIIDAATQTILVNASLEVKQYSEPTVHWFDDSIQFFDLDWFDGGRTPRYYHVSMFFDGRVEIDPYSSDELLDEDFNPLFQIEGGDVDERMRRSPEQKHFFTSDMAYLFGESEAQLTFDPPYNSSGAGRAISLSRSLDRHWDLYGYEKCFTDCLGSSGRVSVYHPATGLYRELSACGISPACVGWVPENVSLDELPPGQSTSVLPAPLNYEWHEPNRLNLEPTHELVCIEETSQYEVRSVVNEQVEIMIPLYEPCITHENPEQNPFNTLEPYGVVFAISPDQRFFAITDSHKSPTYTRFYDAATGELLETLNFEGFNLSFSPDSSILYTEGRFADAAWDINDLVENVDAD